LHVESSITVLRETVDQPGGVLAVIRDISNRKQAEKKVRVSEIRYRRIFEAAQDGVLLVDPDTCRITDANPFMTELLGYSHDQLVGKELYEIGLLRDEVASLEMLRKLKSEHQVRYENLPFKSQGGRHQEVEVVANLYDENGRAVIQCNIRDITERKRAEEHNKLLMAEVNHRSMNLLAVVQAVAHQTARMGDPTTFVARLFERIDGLAASQDLLVKNEWQGVDVADLVEAQLAHFKDLIGTRVLLDGLPARLTPAAAQGIGMALHELATNAGKYGALSNGEGRVHVSWQLAASNEPTFLMSWLEQGGPNVAAPTRKGFGQMVVGRMVEAAVDGTAEIDYRESGFSWRLSAPLAGTLQRGREASSAGDASG
jgi:PAS domain S-box-containing protein